MSSWIRDLRYAARTLARNPGFAALAVLTLGLGIGVNVAIFSAVDAVLFRSLAVRDPGSLVRIYATDEKASDLWNSSYPVFTDYRDGATSFDGMAGFDDAEAFHLATGGGKAERVTGAVVSGNFFDLLGARPQRGRLLSAGDDGVPGAHPMAVVSDRLWRRRFGAEESVVGSTVSINGHPFTIVGVAPRGFTGVDLDSLPDVWVPAAMVDQALPEFVDDQILTHRNLGWLDIVARLKPGASRVSAQAELDVIARRRAASEPADAKRHDPMPRVLPASDFAVGPAYQDDARRLSWLLVGMAGLVLLIACADAAGLLLLRAERRRREIGVRLALGASRRQVGRQLFVESLLLAILGAGAGLLFAVWAAQLLALAVPDEFALPMGAATSVLDARALGFAIGAAGLAALFSGIVPALRGPRVDVLSSIKGGSRRIARLAVGDLLVAGQIALSVVLLVGAGLTARTLAREAAVNPGFDPSGKLEASMDLARQGYDRARGLAFLSQLLDRAAAIPGVRAAALARMVPVQSSGMRTTIESDGYTPAPGETPAADLNIVTPGYFHALGASLVAGRDFDARDRADGPAVAIVSESMARKFWPGVHAVGRRIKNLGPPGVGGEVIGVVRDVRARSLRREADPTVYVPLSQFYMPRMTLLLTTGEDPAALQRPLSRVVAELDPSLPLFHVRTLTEKIGASMGQGRLIALLVGAFAGFGLLLSATGLYGVVSYATQARTREFGIRLALGAQASSVRRLVLSRGARLAAFGLAAGLAAASFASRLAAEFLYGVTPLDPLSYLLAAAILGAAVLAASAAPARRAAKVDPIRALRSE